MKTKKKQFIKRMFLAVAACMTATYCVSFVTANAADNKNTETVDTSVASETTLSAEDIKRLITGNTENLNIETESETEKESETDETDESETDKFDSDYYDTKGNASLIKSEKIIYDSEEMQFISVTTKDGHVFYILINYEAKDDEDNVYFLNKVDDYDLYALMSEGETDNGTETGVADETNTGKKDGRVRGNMNNNNNSKNTESATDETVDEENNSGSNSSSKMILLIGGLAVLGIGGFLLYKFVLNKPKKSKSSGDDDYDSDDYDSGDEDNDE